jgi:hypothetical protein
VPFQSPVGPEIILVLQKSNRIGSFLQVDVCAILPIQYAAKQLWFIERRYVMSSIDLAEYNRRVLKGALLQKFATVPSPASASYSYSEADSALKSVDTIGAARHRGLASSGARRASLHVRKRCI